MEVISRSSSSSSGGVVGEDVVEDTIFVAVGSKVKEGKYTLIWAIQNSRGKKLCLVHVHEPPQTIPILGAEFPIIQARPDHVTAHLAKARQDMLTKLDDYVSICSQAGVQVEKIYIEADSVKKGIVELVSQRRIGKLVMGAASDNKFSRKMIQLMSDKANYVLKEAPKFCHIWFVCKGCLIYTREGKNPNSVDEVRQLSLSFRPMRLQEDSPSYQDLNHVQGSHGKLTTSNFSSGDNKARWSSLKSALTTEEIMDEYDPFISPVCSSLDSEGMGSGSPLSRTGAAADGEPESSYPSPCLRVVEREILSPPSVLETSADDEVFYQLEQALMEAEISKREAFIESMRRIKAEKSTINATRKAKDAESSYAMECRQRKDVEEELRKVKEDLELTKNQRDKVLEELQNSEVQKASLEGQVEKSKLHVKELEEKMLSTVQLLEDCKEEREELQLERDSALREAEELRKQLEMRSSSSNTCQHFCTFSHLEIEKATNYLDTSLKIGRGGYGSIYRGTLRHTEVAVKMLSPDSMQGPEEFYQEVDILSKLRHPNIITLIGVCPETYTLVYEFLPNGSLEDRLVCKDNTPPLSWKVRLHIAAELCSVLIFLHSNKPHAIIHGDLKPANILLDASLRCKLSDFGISRAVSSVTDSNTKVYFTEHPRGTLAYMDPEFLSTGELSAKSDVFSYGVILLRLLTGKPAEGINYEVQYALERRKLDDILDPLAGGWPFVQAHHLASLALRCCEQSRKSRPDLVFEVWRTLETIMASCETTEFVCQFGGIQNQS